nr:gloverin-like [Danaus plexippus plexippus]
MYFLYILFGVIFSASAQEFVEPAFVVEPYPEWYVGQRVRRDVTFDKQIGDGKVFGTLGQNDKGLFGKGGYEHQIFNDHRGTLNAQAYGTRVLGPAGDSSHLGGALNWKNPNAAASFDISKQIHGGTSVSTSTFNKTIYILTVLGVLKIQTSGRSDSPMNGSVAASR